MQANLERGSINKKSYTRKNKQNLNTPILVLSILILLSCVLFLTIDINPGHHEYALSKRVPKLIAIVLTGGCIGFSTIIFQTVTNNRILTPSVMGIDSLYVAVQTILMFVFGSTSIFVTDKRINFLICLVFMILGSLVLYKLIFKRENANSLSSSDNLEKLSFAIEFETFSVLLSIAAITLFTTSSTLTVESFVIFSFSIFITSHFYSVEYSVYFIRSSPFI